MESLLAVSEDRQQPWFGLIGCLPTYFIVTALVAIPNVPSLLLYTFVDMKYSLDGMVTLMGCFQFTADMGSLEFSNQETEYKLRRGT